MKIFKLFGIFQTPKWPKNIVKIEDLFKRFPHISQSIFDKLDNQSLINCKEASRELSEFLENERFFWIRVLRNYSRHYDSNNDFWKIVINRTSIKLIRHLAVATKNFFVLRESIINQINFQMVPSTKTIQFTPMQVAAEFGDLELMKHVLEKICEKIPLGSVMIIPPRYLMSAEIRGLLLQYSTNKICLKNSFWNMRINDWAPTEFCAST